MILLQTSKDTLVNVADSARIGIEHFAEELSKDPGATLQNLIEQGVHFGLKVVAALLIYIIGMWIIKKIKKAMGRSFLRKKTDPTLISFFQSLVTIIMVVLLLLTTIGTLGVNTTSLAALLASAGVAFGMALSGTVQNFAGGIMILLFKPFKAGDFIDAQGYSGTVSEVNIVSTVLKTPDNRHIIIPNGALFNGNIDNYSKMSLRRITWTVSLSYDTDAMPAKEAIMEILKAEPRILDSQTQGASDPFVGLDSLGDSAINFAVKSWVKADDYWDVYYAMNEKIYTELPKKGFSFPFPQMDVHFYNSTATAPDTTKNA